MTAERHTGSCLCGGVAFAIDGPLAPFTTCHCTMCRKQSGHVWPCTTVWRDNFTLLRDDTLKWYQSSADSRRGFCDACGSLLFFDMPGTDDIGVSAGAFDEPTGQKIAMNIWTDFKGDYYDLEPGLTTYGDNDGPDLPMPPRRGQS